MPKTVLIADDSSTIKMAFKMTFMGIDDVEITTADNKAQAFEAAKSQHPDLIVADSNFGDMTGYEFCRMLKDDDELKSIPVWIMTGPFERLDDGQYDACGAEGHVRKPFDTQRMIDAVLKMHAPPEEEKARPSYPAAAAPRPQIPVSPASQPSIKAGAKAPPKPPPVVTATPKVTTLHGQVTPPTKPAKPKKPTIIGTPIVPPVKPQAAPVKPQAPAQKPVSPLDSTLRPHLPGQKPAAVKAPAVKEEIAGEFLKKESYKDLLSSLSPPQQQQLMDLIKDVVEKVVWEVVPDLAETLIKEELNRLLKD